MESNESDAFGFDASAMESAGDLLQPISNAAVATAPVPQTTSPSWGAPTTAQHAAPQTSQVPLSNKETITAVLCIVTGVWSAYLLMIGVITLPSIVMSDNLLTGLMFLLDIPTGLLGAAVGACGVCLFCRIPWAKKAGGLASIGYLIFLLVSVLSTFAVMFQAMSVVSDLPADSGMQGMVGMSLVFGLGSAVFRLVVQGAGPMMMISLFIQQARALKKHAD